MLYIENMLLLYHIIIDTDIILAIIRQVHTGVVDVSISGCPIISAVSGSSCH